MCNFFFGNSSIFHLILPTFHYYTLKQFLSSQKYYNEIKNLRHGTHNFHLYPIIHLPPLWSPRSITRAGHEWGSAQPRLMSDHISSCKGQNGYFDELVRWRRCCFSRLFQHEMLLVYEEATMCMWKLSVHNREVKHSQQITCSPFFVHVFVHAVWRETWQINIQHNLWTVYQTQNMESDFECCTRRETI